MNERVVEILIYIMSEIRRNQSVSTKLDILSQDLIQKGYTETEISSALTWLLDRMNQESEEVLQDIAPAFRDSFRHLHEIERSIISTEAFGYLIQLRELGIIDEMDFEQILERALMLGVAHVSEVDMKSVVASILGSSDGFLDGAFFMLDDDHIVH